MIIANKYEGSPTACRGICSMPNTRWRTITSDMATLSERTFKQGRGVGRGFGPNVVFRTHNAGY